ncbi:sensor domain-containing protein [Streptomyces sp. DSM 42041]|uniref:histidine kinase n=1 Tax=Streptomyces hazeniae TaxID=3075538 RepID=A0ABU2NUF6_9ACTN|nr:sensor domain-containing protein [Streptomyces sp. DSM 42041]MDT0380623.1 sensor domain-containing protein [Streptomyces sp. DSM 42041]
MTYTAVPSAAGRGAAAARRGPSARLLLAPVSGRAWREYGYVATGMVVTPFAFAFAVAMLSAGAGLLVTFLGVPVLAAGLAGCRALGRLERARARALLGMRVDEPEPVRVAQRKPGAVALMGAVLRSGVSWRSMLYALLHLPWAVFSFSLTVSFLATGWTAFLYPAWHWVFPTFTDQPGLQMWEARPGENWYLETPTDLVMACTAGLLVVLATPWLVRGLTTVDRLAVHGLLGPSRLTTRVRELESDRGVVVDTAAADLRRIERDLHDGAQARLVSLAMELGLAKEKLLEDPEAAAKMVGDAHGEVKLALQELRDLARGIHPAILTDRGLGPALTTLSRRCTVPVTLTVDLGAARPAPAIEGITYFTVSELLQNIGKHAGAEHAVVDVWCTADRLLLQVTDDGRGGAQASPGSGLAGLAERLDAVDGLLVVDSPAGGPTTVTAELPWRDPDPAPR